MRTIRSKERKAAGNIYCSFCKPMKVNATYRLKGFADHRLAIYKDWANRPKLEGLYL